MRFLHGLALVTTTSATLVLAGCASPRENAIFVTKTSFSLLDADTTPGGVSIAYDRVEGYVGPRFEDGRVFPVVSSMETSGSGFSREIKQTYATGEAARIVTRESSDNSKDGVKNKQDPSTKTSATASSTKIPVMFFATSTTIGVKVGFDAGTVVPNAFTLGYKRKEASIIPVDKDRHPSVLATFDNTTGVAAPAPAASGATASGAAATQFGVTQYFATGDAADNLASKPSIKGRFKETAEAALGNVEQYRIKEAKQGRIALATLSCLTRVPDNKLDRVWKNVKELEVFGQRAPFALNQISAATPFEQRQVYIRYMSVLEADSDAYTNVLSLHKEAVCILKE